MHLGSFSLKRDSTFALIETSLTNWIANYWQLMPDLKCV
jgi:hypothetical protein